MRRTLLMLAVLYCAGIAHAETLIIGNKGEDSVSFVDLESGRELGRAKTGRMPHEIAISPDGRQAAAVSYGGNSIDIFDIATRARLRTIDLGANDGPHGLVWLDDGRLIATTERSQSLSIVDTAAGDRVAAIATGQRGTHMVAVSSDKSRAYTANMESGTVSVIDLAAGVKLRDISVGGQPEGIVLTIDGKTLWVADREGARVQAFDTALIGTLAEPSFSPSVHLTVMVENGSIEELNETIVAPLERELRAAFPSAAIRSVVATGQAWLLTVLDEPADRDVVMRSAGAALRRAGTGFPAGRTEAELRFLSTAPLATIATGPVPIRLAASPDGRWIVTSNFGSGSLSQIDTATRTVAREMGVSGSDAAQQVTILFSEDGSKIYAAETGRDEVAEIDFASGKVLRRIKAGKQGDGLAIAP